MKLFGRTLRDQKIFEAREFDERIWQIPEPQAHSFMPKPLGFLKRYFPGAVARHATLVAYAEKRYDAAMRDYEKHQGEKEAAFHAFEVDEATRKMEIERFNTELRTFKDSLATGSHPSVIRYFGIVMNEALSGEPDAVSAEIGYSPDSRHLVMDLELPEFNLVPEEGSFRYVKATDRIEAVARPMAKRRAVYSSLISQIALKGIDTIYRAAPPDVVECLTLNGMLDTIDPATGQQVRLCLLSVRVTADIYRTLNLGQVQPEHCLRSLKASVSRSPSELMAVKPIIELDMVDPRFVETMDVISGLDSRPNLMELTPTEFEGLITNLFAAMGLDTRQTRPSRDGGVDCVAFDPRPVFGGKVVIQAKRYKNTVGVSAVRDLFGTCQNEGASKGILVTTSGYGKAAYDFARGKPLELLDGGNLLHLLAEHAAIDARIVMPDSWTDPPLHGE